MKMSKSLGNFRTVRELLTQYKGEVIRFSLLSSHYGSEMNFSAELLDQSRAALNTFYGALREAYTVPIDDTVDVKTTALYAALLDDLNTPMAIAELHQLAKELNKADDADKPVIKSLLLKGANLMGLLLDDVESWFTETAGDEGISPEEIERLIAERLQARTDKNWGRGDEIRDQLKEQGVILEDGAGTTKWKRV